MTLRSLFFVLLLASAVAGWGQPQPKPTTSSTSKTPTTSSTQPLATTSSGPSCFSLDNVGSLPDGQLRYNYGSGAGPVTFSLSNGHLFSSVKNGQCYISSSTQLQCDTPQTSNTGPFTIVGSNLAYAGSTTFYKCDAGTGGGYNIYTTQYYSQCTPLTLKAVPSSCPSTTSAPAPTCYNITNTGSLTDGQLRYNFGYGAYNVAFTFSNGQLFSNINNGQCYISASTQLQCDNPQTSNTGPFTIKNGLLAYAGSTTFYQCDAGTGGGYNIYTTQYYSQCSLISPGLYVQPTAVCQPTTTPSNTPCPVNTQDCSQGCPANALCCNAQCYYSTQYTCYDQGNGKYQLCPVGLKACGHSCYDPAKYGCANGQLVQA